MFPGETTHAKHWGIAERSDRHCDDHQCFLVEQCMHSMGASQRWVKGTANRGEGVASALNTLKLGMAASGALNFLLVFGRA